jgi:hypothetical protein
MKCPQCEYELWNLKAGPCPECGRRFKPSEFDFLANAVRFCCPHCEQAYYGTSETGQLEPNAFDCVSCGRHITTDEMLLRPAEALGSRAATRATNPWLDRNRRYRWFAAAASSIGQPGRMLEATPALGSTGAAFTFAMLNLVAAGSVGLALAFALLMGGGGGGASMLIGMAFITLMIPTAYLLLWTLVTHGLLKLFKQPTPDGMGRTFQALAFTSGAWLFALIPCMGVFFGFIAWSACAPAAVRAAHKARTGPAVVAALVLPIVTVLAVGGLYVAMIVGPVYSATAYGPVAMQGWAQGTSLHPSAIALVDRLRVRVRAGAPPVHGASLLDPASGVTHHAFSEPSNPDVAIGATTASALEAMRTRDRDAALAGVTASWPADVTAHRVGRLIFTYHGIKPGDDPDLALVIVMPGTPGGDWYSIHSSGWHTSSMFPQFGIQVENQRRARAGLPPLPTVQTMTTSTGPWTAADGVAPGTP